jgi:3'(2'), 5'-bisphosphate nucleotidase
MKQAQRQTYDDEMRVALRLAREAGDVIMGFYEGPLHIEQKRDAEDREPVTQADTIANDLIVQQLSREFPEDGILAEESVDTERRLAKPRVWMVDPLDGTTGFIDGNGDFAVQIGLTEAGKCVLGVVYQPVSGLLYRAVSGGGAWVEGPNEEPRRATVSNHADLQQMTLAASRSHRSKRMDRVVKRLDVRKEIQRGSVGIKVGLIVERHCDVYVHLSPRTKQWDTCAPEIILQEAGGELTDLFGGRLRYNVPDVQNRNGLVATNGIAHQNVIRLLKPLLMEFGRARVK